MVKQMNVAIDGPAGAGKSTVAKLVAEALNYIYIDTGAMYRALTYKALSDNIDLGDELALKNILDGLEIKFENSQKGQLTYLNSVDVTEDIRTSRVTNHVSIVATHKDIRLEMVKRQQQLAKNGGTVMDGRDIGTHVIPDAEVKIFMTASVDERAKRRHEQNIEKGQSSDLQKLKEEIQERDRRDMEREVAPLKKAEDAIELDTTFMDIEEVVQSILIRVNERRDQKHE